METDAPTLCLGTRPPPATCFGSAWSATSGLAGAPHCMAVVKAILGPEEAAPDFVRLGGFSSRRAVVLPDVLADDRQRSAAD